MCASLASGEFPTSLKTSIVRPRKLKKLDLDSEIYQNYRPPANISFMSIVIEKSVAIHTYSYLNNNALFPSLQSAYRAHHSTETALLRALDYYSIPEHIKSASSLSTFKTALKTAVKCRFKS